MTSSSYIKRIGYTKYIFSKGKEELVKKTQLSCAVAILHFHDALELFLDVYADICGYKPQESLMSHWAEAENKGKPLPNKNELSKLNRLRVAFKHYGLLPIYDDCIEAERTLDSFFSLVSLQLLGIDFKSISLSDLITNRSIREQLLKSEKYLNENGYEKSLIAVAKAFALIFKEAKGDPWHSYLLDSSFFPFNEMRMNLSSISKEREIEKNFRTIDENLSIMKKRFNTLIDEMNVLLLGIDNYKYIRFKLLTPHCNVYMDGHVETGGTVSVYFNKYNFNLNNATFCFNFVLDTALKLQENSNNLINAASPKKVIVIANETALYSNQNEELKEIGKAKKGEKYEAEGISGSEYYNGAIYQGVVFGGNYALIKGSDVEPCE